MRCYLNIGNTHTQILYIAPDRLNFSDTVNTADFSPEMIHTDDLSFIGAACVVERLFPVLKDINARMVTPEAASKFVDFSLVDTSTLGQDRIANAVHLTRRAVLPAVSLDFGTCITAEVVDDQKRFLGGAIFPGRTLTRRALNLYTSKLPVVELADELPPCPGANTVDAIRLGTDAAAVDAVAGFLARVEKMLGCRPTVYACGGDRAFFLRAPELAGMTDGGDDFTLRGVELLFG
ncbi:MAG: type III pantothenate kinase [Lentisphaeria bacterium]|nr:type III pantothenate kinase [Lentisphaeria bacterium]